MTFPKNPNFQKKKIKMEESEKMTKKQNIDRIFEVIDENAKYPRFLCAGLSLILWTVAGSFITSDVILAALPGIEFFRYLIS